MTEEKTEDPRVRRILLVVPVDREDVLAEQPRYQPTTPVPLSEVVRRTTSGFVARGEAFTAQDVHERVLRSFDQTVSLVAVADLVEREWHEGGEGERAFDVEDGKAAYARVEGKGGAWRYEPRRVRTCNAVLTHYGYNEREAKYLCARPEGHGGECE